MRATQAASDFAAPERPAAEREHVVRREHGLGTPEVRGPAREESDDAPPRASGGAWRRACPRPPGTRCRARRSRAGGSPADASITRGDHSCSSTNTPLAIVMPPVRPPLPCPTSYPWEGVRRLHLSPAPRRRWTPGHRVRLAVVHAVRRVPAAPSVGRPQEQDACWRRLRRADARVPGRDARRAKALYHVLVCKLRRRG